MVIFLQSKTALTVALILFTLYTDSTVHYNSTWTVGSYAAWARRAKESGVCQIQAWRAVQVMSLLDMKAAWIFFSMPLDGLCESACQSLYSERHQNNNIFMSVCLEWCTMRWVTPRTSARTWLSSAWLWKVATSSSTPVRRLWDKVSSVHHRDPAGELLWTLGTAQIRAGTCTGSYVSLM